MSSSHNRQLVTVRLYSTANRLMTSFYKRWPNSVSTLLGVVCHREILENRCRCFRLSFAAIFKIGWWSVPIDVRTDKSLCFYHLLASVFVCINSATEISGKWNANTRRHYDCHILSSCEFFCSIETPWWASSEHNMSFVSGLGSFIPPFLTWKTNHDMSAPWEERNYVNAFKWWRFLF